MFSSVELNGDEIAQSILPLGYQLDDRGIGESEAEIKHCSPIRGYGVLN
jgi:hypothetical protein